MSEDSSQEKTEQPTARKLEKARERGQVARSNDVPTALILLLTVLYFWLAWDWLVQHFKDMFDIVPRLYAMPFPQAMQTGLLAILDHTMWTIAVPFAMIAFVGGILGNVIQFGILFAIDPIIPNLSKVSLSSGFKRIFSAKQVVTTLLALLKTLVLAAVLWVVIRIGLSEFLHPVSQCDVACQQTVVESLTRLFILITVPLLLVIAVLDYLFQHQQFIKEQRMTKAELKRELKDIFGDPHVRGARNSLRREMAEQDIQKRIRTARLVIIDMGLAVALQYEQGVTQLPILVAIGKGNMARKMAEIATLENVPIVSDPALVQDIVSEGKIDQYIPEKTINKVATLLHQTQAKVKK
ncbi:MAG: flagellar biosynthesis protein FlhB [Thiothrix sp.]